jgi:hypothetical protein
MNDPFSETLKWVEYFAPTKNSLGPFISLQALKPSPPKLSSLVNKQVALNHLNSSFCFVP